MHDIRGWGRGGSAKFRLNRSADPNEQAFPKLLCILAQAGLRLRRGSGTPRPHDHRAQGTRAGLETFFIRPHITVKVSLKYLIEVSSAPSHTGAGLPIHPRDLVNERRLAENGAPRARVAQLNEASSTSWLPAAAPGQAPAQSPPDRAASDPIP